MQQTESFGRETVAPGVQESCRMPKVVQTIGIKETPAREPERIAGNPDTPPSSRRFPQKRPTTWRDMLHVSLKAPAFRQEWEDANAELAWLDRKIGVRFKRHSR